MTPTMSSNLSVNNAGEQSKTDNNTAGDVVNRTRLTPTPFKADEYMDMHPGIDGNFSKALIQSLHESGCMDVEDLPFPNLENAIHPTFSPENFPDLLSREDSYAYLKPTLQLASKFLQEDSVLDFFQRLVQGRWVNDSEGQAYIDYVEPDKDEDIVKAKNATRDLLLEVAKSIKFYFFTDAQEINDYEENDTQTYGFSAPSPETLQYWFTGQGEDIFRHGIVPHELVNRPRVVLSSCFRKRIINEAEGRSNMDLSHKLRF